VSSGYQQEPLAGGRVRFTVTPAPAPRASVVPFVLAAAFVLIVIGSMGPREGAIGWILRVGIAGCGGYATHKLTNHWLATTVDKLRSPGGTFVVSAESIEAGAGTIITRDRLRRLIVRNGIPNVVEPTVVSVGSIYSGAQAGSRNGRVPQRAKVAVISFMLCAESGDTCATLGGGMTEGTALGLLTDVSRILSLA
jgi:hypothetical protein